MDGSAAVDDPGPPAATTDAESVRQRTPPIPALASSSSIESVPSPPRTTAVQDTLRSSAPSPDPTAVHIQAQNVEPVNDEESALPREGTPERVTSAAEEGQHSPTSSSSSQVASSSSPSAQSQHPTIRRVKLYRLQDDAWIDLGTGHCAVQLVETPAQQPTVNSSPESATKSSPADKADNGAWIIVKREVPAKESEGGDPSSEGDLEGGDVILRSKVMPYPPGYLSDEDDFDLDDDQDAAAAGKVYDLGGYQRQQDTLIVWTEPTGEEMALSFATPSGCADIWDFIRTARKWAQDQTVTSPSPSPSLSSPQPFPHYNLASAAPNRLPDPTLGNIAEVEQSIRNMARTAVGRERTASMIVKTQIVQKLIKVHEEAEDLESLEDLHALCRVMQMILLLNDNVIFDLILRDDIILGAVSILEYDPEFPTMKAAYREHLADSSHFTQVVPIRNPTLLAKIHQTHRLHYLKDVVLARILEDSTFSMLNSAIYFNEVDIVNEVASDGPFLKELFAIFDQEDDVAMSSGLDKGKGKDDDEPMIGPMPPTAVSIGPQMPPSSAASTSTASSSAPALGTITSPAPSDRKHDAILFLQQFASMAKNLQLPLRAAFFRSLADRGLLRVIEVALSRPLTRRDPTMRGATIAILMMLVDHDPNNVRAYSLKQKAAGVAGTRPLMALLIELFQNEEDLGLKAQMSEALRVLVDTGGDGGPLEAPPRVRPEDPEAEKFLQYFYDDCAEPLFAPILSLPDRAAGDPLMQLSVQQVALCGHLCDLLCFFVSHHTFRSKFFVLSSSLGTHVVKLFYTRHKHLRLAALRFLRATLAKNDDFYNRFLMKNDLFRPALELAWNERKKDNLLASACLEFFEYIRTSNPKAVINHLLERYGDRVRQLAATLTTFDLLIKKWEQNNEPPPSFTGLTGPSTSGPTSKLMTRENSTTWHRMDEDDKYFNESDEEEEPAVSGTAAAGEAAATPSATVTPVSTWPPTVSASASNPTTSASATSAEPRTSMKRSGSLVSLGSGDSDDEEDELSSANDERSKRLRLEASSVDEGPPEFERPQGSDVNGGFEKASKDHEVAPGGFMPSDEAAEVVETTPEATPPPSLPPLRKREDDDEEDGQLGLLSKNKFKKSKLGGTGGNGTAAGAGGVGASLLSRLGNQFMKKAPAVEESKTSSPTGTGGGIKISLGIKSSLSKLGEGGGKAVAEKKLEEESRAQK